MWVILHSQTMTDQQIAHAIGEDPFAVLRRSGMMMKAIAPRCYFRRLPRRYFCEKEDWKSRRACAQPVFLVGFFDVSICHDSHSGSNRG